MVYAQPSTCPWKWHIHKILWDFNIQTDHLISARRPDLIIINKKKKKKICKIVDFAVPADHRIKLKECEKRDKYLDLARELKKLWNMKMTIIPIVIGAFGTVTKRLLKGPEDLEVGGRVETIQTTALLKTARILRRVPETWGVLLSLNLQWKSISLRWCEKLEWIIIIIIIIIIIMIIIIGNKKTSGDYPNYSIIEIGQNTEKGPGDNWRLASLKLQLKSISLRWYCRWCSCYSHQRFSKMSRGLGNKWRLLKLQHCWDQPEYWEKSWRLEETSFHSDSSKRPSAIAVGKNSREVKR